MDKKGQLNILKSLIEKNEGQKFYYDCAEFKIKNGKLYLYSEIFFSWQPKDINDFSEIEIQEIIKQLRERNTYNFDKDS